MKNKGMDQGKCKILIIRFSSMGDILLSTPFIRQVRNFFPGAEISYVIKEEYKELLQYNSKIDQLLVYSKMSKGKGLKEIKDFIKKEKYNYIFDLHNNFRSIYLRMNRKAGYVNHIRKDKLKQVALVYLKKNFYNTIVSIPERYFNVAKDIDILPDNKGLELYWKKDISDKVENYMFKKGLNPEDNFISIAPGASFYNKRWPVEFFEEVISMTGKNLKYKFTILGDKNDQYLGKKLSASDCVYDMTGQLSMLESAIIIAKSRALLSNDSGLMHMAAAVNTPVLAIFGSTVKELGFFPYKVKNSVVEIKNLKCRPCSHIGKNHCPKKHFRCMLDIKPDIVWKKLIQLVKDN